MTRWPLRIGSILLLCAAGCGWSCSRSPSAPSEEAVGPLRLTASIAQTAFAPDGETMIVFTLENRGARDLVLTFPSSCQILPYIRAGAAIVYPPGGSWACLTVITTMTLRGGGSVAREVRVRAAASAESPVVPLPPGDYTAYARVDATEYHLRSRDVAFTVR